MGDDRGVSVGRACRQAWARASGGSGEGLNGGMLAGGLGGLLDSFNRSGHGDIANSWVGTGPNRQIAPNDLASALGADQIDQLSSQFGMSRDELLSGMSQQLPEVVDQLTPHGRLPTEQEASNWI